MVKLESSECLIIIIISIYHTSEKYFSCTLIDGYLGADYPSTIHLRAAEEKQDGFLFCHGDLRGNYFDKRGGCLKKL